MKVEIGQVDFPGVLGLEGLVKLGRDRFPEVYLQWRAVGAKLAECRGDPRGHAFEYLDANIDLTLRVIEEEQLKARLNFGKRFDGGGFFAQISLSKMWLFAVYEVVRQTCEQGCKHGAIPSRKCEDASCYCCQTLKPVRNRLNCFRIPLAKLQPEDAQSKRAESKINYHAELVVDEDCGSVGWRAESGRTQTTEVTSRLALSNFVLSALL